MTKETPERMKLIEIQQRVETTEKVTVIRVLREHHTRNKLCRDLRTKFI